MSDGPSVTKVFQQRAAGGPGFMAFLFIIGLLIIVWANGGSQPTPPSEKIVKYPPAVEPSDYGKHANYYACQPGIDVGAPVSVLYTSVRMRRSPGHVGKHDSSDTVHYLKTGDTVTVLDGPVIKDGLCWWHVKHTNQVGWSADHSSQGLPLLALDP